MLPSILANEIHEATRRFLITAYEASDGYFHGIMQRYVEGEAGVGKGPYLQVGLPFRTGTTGKRFFPGFEVEHPGFAHQEHAWQRLASNKDAANTLVATGTGSGKTECFLYPILDHCLRARQQGQVHGIKALIIYPMNALASDQARRFAEVIDSTPAFRGLRVGMYVGGTGGQPGTGNVMTPAEVITDRDTLRRAPPDILLTNYKMLDYLLIRPKDRKLWAHNDPEVLRYVVVDELHTFDGAQGTDLSLLLRRLRARLGSPDGQVIYAGTSATLGDGDTQPLREYAGKIFASEFPPESVVSEKRDSISQFLGEEPIEFVLQARTDIAEVLAPSSYDSPEAAIAAWFDVFFPDQARPNDVGEAGWRGELGKLLKRHLLFQNLLRFLKGDIGEQSKLAEQMASSMPATLRPHAVLVLEALVALLSWARDAEAPTRPLATVRVQLWMRELRRLVAGVEPIARDAALHSAADLRADIRRIYLPLVQCSECRTTGWLGRLPAATQRLDMDLETIYNAWFRSATDVARLYPRLGVERVDIDARGLNLCGQCGAVQSSEGPCESCSQPTLVPVWHMLGERQTTKGDVVSRWHDKVCPVCSVQDRLLLVGARNATLGAQLIEQSWSTRFNDDKKLIAFSDSVQDAAHRAGFFGSRTYLNNVRMAMTRVLDAAATPTVPWNDYLERLPQHWSTAMAPEAFVTEFIGPNMLWQHDWSRMQEVGKLPPDGRLLERVRKRLAWQAVSEFTYLSRRGRTLDRLGIATLCLPAQALDATAERLSGLFAENFGLRDIGADELLRWLWGLVIRMRQRGSITHPEMQSYFRDGGIFSFLSNPGRELWLPPIGTFAPHPVMLSLDTHRDFDRLVQDGRKSWYENWLNATLGACRLMPAKIAKDLYSTALDALHNEDLVVIESGISGRAAALNAESLVLETRVVQLQSTKGRRSLSVPEALAERLLGMPCLDAMQERYDFVEQSVQSSEFLATRFHKGEIRRVIAAEHTGLLERKEREAIEGRFKAKTEHVQPWFENLLSATPTLEMGVDIGNLSSVLLCSVPPSQASYLQRIGRAGRRDGNAVVVTLADGASPHDLYFYTDPMQMMAGHVAPPGVFLQAAEVLRRQLLAFCIDAWVASGIADTAFPDKSSAVLDAIDRQDQKRFPYNLLDFIKQDEVGLLERFFGLLGDDLQPRVESRLRDYMLGQGDQDGLRLGLLKMLEDLAKERRGHKQRAAETKKRIVDLKAQPQDEAARVQIAELTRERDKALELSREIGGRELLATLTDAGLIPNYAFPEAGIELKSMIWRKRGDGEDGSGAYIALPAERYERPAASALSEFAPESRFYANRRRVEIDQINMQLANAEQWRLCPNCQYMENIDSSGDIQAVCPRCSDAMWANVSQKRTLLRFRQAMATVNDAKSRIDDSSDDREPRFFVRQLLVDFEQADVEIAWRLQSDSVSFGFEFIRRASFRDINFGERGRNGESFRVADRDAVRPGFKLCRLCGMVQKPPKRTRDRRPGPSQTHARDCSAYGNQEPENILNCLYLYREFASEALRILVPHASVGLDEVVLQSFMAAVQVGLKERFGGKVDHLRITPQEEPAREGVPRRQYVLLYDSVPGGTGYLHQLLSEDAQTLSDVLRAAYAKIKACDCHSDPEKDGCYRCVYQYRQGRAMAQVSRTNALQTLEGLVGNLENLERIKSLSEIFINPQFDSILESRFVESLRRLSGAKTDSVNSTLPVVRIQQEIVKGRSGYLLEVGSERYWVRPQVEIGLEQGVAASSRADFLIEPVRSGSARRPIAIFADGWAYHRDSLRDDARKRSALVASGNFWVWSVTWDDVEAALLGESGAGPDALANHWRWRPDYPPVAQMCSRLGVTPARNHENSVAGLLRWLGLPCGAARDDQALASLQREAAIMAFRMVAIRGSAEEGLASKALEEIAEALPAGCGDAVMPAFAASHDLQHPMVVCYAWPRNFAEGSFDSGFGAVRLSRSRADSKDDLKHAWQQWLKMHNLLQVLPNLWLLEDEGVLHGDYAALAGNRNGKTDGADPWSPIFAEALSEMHPGLVMLRDGGQLMPDQVGRELESGIDGVVAEAELVWDANRIVVLAEHQLEQQKAWEALGWNVVLARDDSWASRVVELLRERE